MFLRRPVSPAAEARRLTAADASNVVMEINDQVNVFMLAGILGVGGFVSADGETDLSQLRTALSARLGLVSSAALARFSERINVEGRTLTWERCQPDLQWHVRAIDPVDGPDGLARLSASLMTVPMSLDRPLWELLVVPGAAPRGTGIILRVHHALGDGVTGVRLLQLLFDGPPTATIVAAPARSAPVRPRWRTSWVGLKRVAAVFRATVPPTVLLGPIGARRDVAFIDVELHPLARAAKAAGATINDALLAAVAVAAEAALRADGHPVPPVLPASVPVALPGRDASGNAVGVMLVPLPTGEPDAGVRLFRIAATTRAAKSEARAQGTFELTRTRWGSRLFARLARHQHLIALFVTNVRGPDQQLRVAGAPLERAWPIAPIQGNVRLGVAALSYAGRLGIGVHTDADAIRARVVGNALREELASISTPG